MLKKYTMEAIRFIFIVAIFSLVGKVIGTSLAIHQNKKDAQEYLNSASYVKVYKACMVTYSEEDDAETSCVEFEDNSSKSYNI